MKRYRVYGGIAKLGPGQRLLLSAEQIKARLPVLDLPKDAATGETYDPRSKDAKPAEVLAKGPTEFKVGEIIGLPELPQHLINMLEPLQPPEGDREVKAADRALEVKDPKAAAARQAGKKKAAADAKAAKQHRRG